MTRNLRERAFRIVLVTAIAALPCAPLGAANPSSGSVSGTATQASWTGGPKTPTASNTCGSANNSQCDNYKLTITPPAYSFKVEISIAGGAADDYDLEVYGPDGSLAGSSGNSPGEVETVVLTNPAGGTYTVSASPYAPLTGYSGTAKVSQIAPPPPASTEKAPAYANYPAPSPLGQSAGEPSIGFDRATGKAMYVAGTETLRVSFNDCSSPATAKWENVSATLTSQITFDPILCTDQALGRTFVSQLLPAKVSLMAYTDDDGATWLPSQGSGINSGVDHQTIGTGPFAPGVLKTLASYPRIVYYCSQDIGLAQCATSLDGGRTFGVAVPIYNLTQCVGIHGHVKVAPDGTAYVPNKNCGGSQGLAVSRDNGLTWTVKTVPGSASSSWDPSLGIAKDGTVYFGYMNGDGHPYVAVSHDEGDTWTNIQDVGTPLGLQNIAFPAVVAGDPDRAAFAFLGTTTGGDLGGEDPNAPAVWHLYVSHTYDGGVTWVTTDATPNDPVQRGTICSAGTTCGGTRNLLDFMDATVDAQGRVLVGYADGCVGGCVNGGTNSGTALATIARESSGKGVYAAYDLPLSYPAAPYVQATQSGGTVHVTWSTPDDHGSPILGYRLSRRPTGGSMEQFLGVGADVHAYDETPPAGTQSYSVKAVNAQGEGPACGEATLVVAPPANQACTAPGVRLATDPAGDSLVPALDVQSLSIAEPPSAGGARKIVFTLKVASLSTFTPGNAWMILWNRPLPDATYDRNYVVMRATGLGTVAYKYGKISPPNVNQATDLGNAVGSYSADGTITLTITPAQADNVAVGQDLPAIEVRTFAANVSGQPSSQTTSIDHTDAANYTLVGTAACGGQ